MGRVIPILVALAAALAGLMTIEELTARRRFEEHTSRMSSIREGMSESDVYAAAGPPSEIVMDAGDETDPFVGASSPCRNANGVMALLYSTEYLGWVSTRLEASPTSSQTDVICLNAQRIVVKTYANWMYSCMSW